mgnify:FL=1
MEIQEIANYKNLGSLYNVELIGESRVKLHIKSETDFPYIIRKIKAVINGC